MAERTRLFPCEGVLGEVLGDWADLVLRRAHKNTRSKWFGPPERNTLRPLGEVLISVVYESILCRALALTQPEFPSSGRPLL